MIGIPLCSHTSLQILYVVLVSLRCTWLGYKGRKWCPASRLRSKDSCILNFNPLFWLGNICLSTMMFPKNCFDYIIYLINTIHKQWIHSQIFSIHKFLLKRWLFSSKKWGRCDFSREEVTLKIIYSHFPNTRIYRSNKIDSYTKLNPLDIISAYCPNGKIYKHLKKLKHYWIHASTNSVTIGGDF